MHSQGFLKKGRIIFLLVTAGIFSLLILVQYSKLAFAPVENVDEQHFSVSRGSILDKNGKPLAVSTNFYNVGITPSSIPDSAEFVKLYAPILKIDETRLISMISSSRNSQYILLKKKADQELYEQLKDITEKNGYYSAVRFDPVPGRIYPENNLASQVIGYMGVDGEGLSGIEKSRQQILSPAANPQAPLDIKGQNIFLTIDANLQFKLEKIARNALETTQASSLMLIAAEAKTGEILSYISLPAANLNEYPKASNEEKKDRPAMENYEPGSVFKIFSIASFFDSGAITENDIFLCDGIFEKKTNSGEKIKITCLDHHGWITARDALKYSCNDALAQMAERIESEQFLDRIRSFGFGSKTGIELPGETQGSVRNTSDRFWSARSKPTIAIGQEISVSALQMVQAASALANGGSPVQLTLIKKITTMEGAQTYTHIPQLKNQIIKDTTASYILSCMETVAKSGTGSRANLKDISIGVKTGTAQMADSQTGGYSKTDFISNCIAIFPIEDPEIILYIVIEKAKGETYAGRIVAPVIGEAASVIIDHLGISRGNAASLAHSGLIRIKPDSKINLDGTIPDLTGLPKRQLLQLLLNSSLNIKINGDGWVKSQTPPPGTPLEEGMEIELYLE